MRFYFSILCLFFLTSSYSQRTYKECLYRSELIDSLENLPVDSITQFENDLLNRYWVEEDSLKAIIIRDSIDRFVRIRPVTNECLDLFLETDYSSLDTSQIQVMNWRDSPPGKMSLSRKRNYHIEPRLCAFKPINDSTFLEYEIVFYYLEIVNSKNRVILSSNGARYSVEMKLFIASDDFQSATVTLVYLVDEKNRLFKIKRNFKL